MSQFAILFFQLGRRLEKFFDDVTDIKNDIAVIKDKVINIENELVLIKSRLPVPTPRDFDIKIYDEEFISGENAMPQVDMMVFKIHLPALPAKHDIVQVKVDFAVDGVLKDTFVVPSSATEVVDLKAKEGSTATITLTNIDNNGNPSPNPRSKDFVMNDTIAPPDAGDFGIEIVGEVFEDDGVVPSPAP